MTKTKIVLSLALLLFALPLSAKPPHNINLSNSSGTVHFSIPSDIFAQTITPNFSIQFQQGGSNITGGFFNESPLNLNCSTNLTCTISGSTLTMVATGGGSGSPCVVTPNSLQYNNAGTFGCVTQFTYSGSTVTGANGTLDLSGMTLVKLRFSAGLATTLNGDFGYDTTANRWHIWQNGADKFSIAASNVGASGQPCLSNADGSCTFSDPQVQGTQAAASTTIPNPVVSGGSDYGGTAAVRTQKIDASGNFYVALASAPTLTVNLPQQPLLNTTDFNDVVAASPTRGDLIVANSTPKWARFGIGAAGTLWESNGTDPSYTATLTANPYSFTGKILAKNIEGIRYVDDANTAGWAGADVCAQEASAEADLPATGGVIDMRGLQSTLYACTGTWTVGTTTRSVYIYLPAATINPSGSPGINVLGSVFFIGVNPLGTVGGSSRLNVSVGANTTVLWQGSRGGMQDVFINSGSAAGLYLQATSTIDVRGNNFRNIRTSCNASAAGSIGIRMTAFSASFLVTENTIGPFISEECETDIQLDAATTQGPTDNYFNGITTSSTTGAGIASINVINADVNHFGPGILQNKAIGIKVVAGVHNDFDFIRFESDTVDINNAGTGTGFYGISIGDSTFTNTDAAVTIIGHSNGTYKMDFNKFIGSRVPVTKVMASSSGAITTTTLGQPGGMTVFSWNVLAGETYSFVCELYYQISSVTGVPSPAMASGGTATMTSIWYAADGYQTATLTTEGTVVTTAGNKSTIVTTASTPTTTNLPFRFRGAFTVNAGGTFLIQAANFLNAGASTTIGTLGSCAVQ